MKKPQLNILVAITAVFTAFVLGFFLGRNYNHTDIQLSVASQVPETQPIETVAAQMTKRFSEETEPPVVAEPPAPPEATMPQASEESQSQTEAVPPQVEAAPPQTEAPQSETEPPTEPDTSVSSGLININTATRAQLESLPGIGEVLAQRIIDYREAYGPFTSIAQLTNVSGIGEKRLAAIIDLVTVG